MIAKRDQSIVACQLGVDRNELSQKIVIMMKDVSHRPPADQTETAPDPEEFGSFVTEDAAPSGQVSALPNATQSKATSGRYADKLRAALEAARTESVLLFAKLQLRRCKNEANRIQRECGSLAVSDAVDLEEPGAAAICQAGVRLLGEVKAFKTEMSALNTATKKLDRKLEVAKVREAEKRIAILKKLSGQKTQTLLQVHKSLGSKILESEQVPERFKPLGGQLRIAIERVERMQASIRTLDQHRLQLQQRIGFRYRPPAVIVSLVLVVALLWVFHPIAHLRPTASTVLDGSRLNGDRLQAGGLTLSQLKLSSQLITTSWSAWLPGRSGIFSWSATPDATQGCEGSGGVFDVGNGKLRIFTNRHVLMVNELADPQLAGLALKTYDLQVKFSSGQTRPVLQVFLPEGSGSPADDPRHLDVAILEVAAAGLSDGVDYTLLLPIGEVAIQPGDETVAVGNPAGLEGTETFGRISALRDYSCDDGVVLTWLQTDAAINLGNSGGPLFVKRDNQYWWAGISTLCSSNGYQGLNFALHSKHVIACKGVWYDSSPAGIAKAMSERYGASVGVYSGG